MSFPQTRPTLIERLAAGGSEEDWQCFLHDYWGPICRFSLRFGAQNLDDAEEVASETFEVLWEKSLLDRWTSQRSAKLRTLLCTVVRNILSHRHRVRKGHERLLPDLAEQIDASASAHGEQVDAFYAAWVEDVVQQAVDSLAVEYCGRGRANHLRVLHGRLCLGLTFAQVAELLEITPAAADHALRDAKRRLSEKLEEVLRGQVERYCPAEEVERECSLEWRQLAQYLAEHGGLEDAVRRAHELLDPSEWKKRERAALSKTVTRLTSIQRPPT
jgi:RNA polymerase sigma factor (sigma-70 family)